MHGSDSALKASFLAALQDKLTVDETCKHLSLKRQKIEAWRRNDAEFREELEMLELNIIDRVKLLALKKLGIIQFTEHEKSIGLHKWADNSLISAFLKREQINVNVNNSPTPLPIAGLSPDVLKGLSTPEVQKDDIPTVDLLGVPRSTLTKKTKDDPEVQDEPGMIQ